ncbi:response regulator transcription factor [Albibacterium indicum]|uniref:response regulator transcription factor n=1 Tax=Albibacterium indicum TaxID=2292082 RepID=UPI000E5541CE|nr:LuxR C-terminal-related transcriptional regulator [Pedobacter indicus]
MEVFGTEMLLITFIFVVLESVMFFYQLIYYLSRPEEKQRLYYLILLLILIVYNITGGLFPDPEIALPIVAQNSIAYGCGFLMASYFPFYFYKAFELNSLRFHAIYGVLLFFLLPFFIFFVIVYSVDNNLDFAIKNGVVIPFFYSFVILWQILKAIRIKFKDRNEESFMEVLAMYAAVIPWAAMPLIAYFDWGQRVEVLCTNGGLIVITFMFLSKSVKTARLEYQQLLELSLNEDKSSVFDENSQNYNLTNREIEIVQLLREGNKYQTIAEKLYISESTVKTHVRNVYDKTGVCNRVELVHKMEQRA